MEMERVKMLMLLGFKVKRIIKLNLGLDKVKSLIICKNNIYNNNMKIGHFT